MTVSPSIRHARSLSSSPPPPALVVAIAVVTAASGRLAGVAAAAPEGVENQCIVCHLELEDEEMTPPATLFADDIHARAGLSCTACHGGDDTTDDEETAMDPERGFIGRPEPAAIPGLCGRCHSDEAFIKSFSPSLPTDQEAKYRTSGHGRALAAGSADVATCASCHGAHGIREADDPGSPVYATNLPRTCDQCHGNPMLMSRHGMTADQFDQYSLSVHGVALLEKADTGAPACNDCHGSHGAQPPGVAAVHNVCGTCHFNNREYFMQSPHAADFGRAGGRECVTCHGYHGVRRASDAMLGLGDHGLCRKCHSADDDGGRVAVRLSDMVDSLRIALDETHALIDRAEQLGMPVEEAIYLWGEGHENLVKMRTEIHAASVAVVADDFRQGLDSATQAGHLAGGLVQEFSFRRRGLAVATTLTTVLIVLLIIGIRRLDAADARERVRPG